MKKLLIISCLISFTLFFSASSVFASLVNIVDPGFESALTQTTTGYGGADVWYAASPKWAQTYSSTAPDGTHYANYGKDGTQSLYQVVNFSGTTGTVTLTFSAQYNLSNTSNVYVYGSTSRPSTGGTYFGDQILTGPITGSSGWTSLTFTGTATKNYSWYTILFSGNTTGPASNNYLGIDKVSLDVKPVPIPPTVWLLGAGLLGLVGIRRRFWK